MYWDQFPFRKQYCTLPNSHVLTIENFYYFFFLIDWLTDGPFFDVMFSVNYIHAYTGWEHCFIEFYWDKGEEIWIAIGKWGYDILGKTFCLVRRHQIQYLHYTCSDCLFIHPVQPKGMSNFSKYFTVSMEKGSIIPWTARKLKL